MILRLSPPAKRLLLDLYYHGGIFDRWNRVVASGHVTNSNTVLSCFRKRLIHMNIERVQLSNLGAKLVRKRWPDEVGVV